ncbi:MAG TPA: glycosyltransferase [Mycobacteriales bacterium]|nr:glycosyltransferase [Mycobacteriales bacterium]
MVPRSRRSASAALGISILNWNNPVDTVRCLTALHDAGAFDTCFVVVIDNGSTDDSVPVLERWIADNRVPANGRCRLVALDTNTGYGAGNNVGLRLIAAEGLEWAWVLNNDTRVSAASFSRLMDLLSAGVEDADAIGVRIHLDGTPADRDVVGGGWTRRSGARVRALRAGEHPDVAGHPGVCFPGLDFVSGAAMVIRVDVLRKIGLLPEDHFLFWEEVEIGDRLRAAGARIGVTPSVIVEHVSGATSGVHDRSRKSTTALYYATRAAILTTRKHRRTRLPLVVSARLANALAVAARQRDVRAGIACLRGLVSGLTTTPRPAPRLHELPAGADPLELTVLHVDHSGDPGGGQLGLLRYLQQPSGQNRRALFLSGGPVATQLARAGLAELSALDSASLGRLVTRRGTLRREVDAFGADLVVANSFRAAVALAIAGVHTVYYARQDMRFRSLGPIAGTIGYLAVLPRSAAYIANSQWTLSTLPKLLRRRRPTATAYPVSGLADLTDVADHREPARLIRLLWLGRIVPWKGLDVLLATIANLEATGRMPAARLTVAGAPLHHGPRHQAKVARLAARLTTPVELLGHVEDIPNLLTAHDVLIHTSVRPEPFGQVILQGMAAGMTVIATREGGPQDLIDDGVTGLLVPPRDRKRLGDVLVRTATDDALRARLSANARDRALTVGDAAMAQAYDEALRTIHNALRLRLCRRYNVDPT